MNKLFTLMVVGLSFSAVSCTSDKQIEDWIAKNPEKILKSVMDYQRGQQEANQPKPEMVKENAKALFERSESPTRGDGKIKIAYFFDFNCGHCKRQTEVIKSVLKNTKEVQIIYKNFPVLGPSSEVAARAALAAHQQHKYIEFFDELQNVQQKTPEEMTKIAKKLGLDMKKWEADQNGEAVNDELNSVRELATNMKIGGTPFLAIAPDKIFPGRVDQLQEIVNTML